MNRWIWKICAALLTTHSSSAVSYEPSTHEILSRQAAERSKIYTDPALLTDLGLAVTSTFMEVNILGQPVELRDAKTIVGRGAVHEDDVACGSWARPLNHFFDPQHNGRGLTVAYAVGVASPDWALEDRGEVATISAPHFCAAGGLSQVYSYRDAQQYLFNALTGQTANYRHQEISRAFQTLGNIIHHVQDMAQPQHTRNDTHSPYEGKGKSYYERYTESEVDTRIPQILAAAPAYPIPTFATARHYWVTSSSPNVGMAEFTSNNYVSYGTSFVVVPGLGILPNAGFPNPNATNADGTHKRIETRNVTIEYGDHSGESGPMDLIVGDVFDGYTGAHNTGRVLAATSLLHIPLSNTGLGGKFSTNEKVFEDNYSILIPRAVAFSAGLINHFFEGKIDVVRATNGGWEIRNLFSGSMTGTFELYYDDGASLRYPVASAGGRPQSWTGTLAGGASTPALAEPVSSAKKVVAVFRGTIGSETALMRVAGRVVDYAAPPIPCEGTLKASGGIEGLDTTREMGSTKGTVQLSFEAFSVKDSLVVTSRNSSATNLANTSGMVSGFHQRTFTFDPSALGNTKVRVRIVGSEQGTAWNIAMSCPGGSLDSEDFPPRRVVTFNFGGKLDPAQGSCQANFYVNGDYKGLAYVSAAGGTSISATLTKGSGHGAEFRSFSCTTNASNLLTGSSFRVGSGAATPLQNMGQAGIRLFDVP